jgi:hypothetical protein
MRVRIDWLGTVGKTLVLVAVLNFVLFWIIGVSIGGEALTGKIEDGRYFLREYGRYTEVTHGVWMYSKVHTISVYVTFPLAFIGTGMVVFSKWRGRIPQKLPDEYAAPCQVCLRERYN